MSKHEVMTGGFDPSQQNDNVVHPDNSPGRTERRAAIKLLDSQARTGVIDNKEYMEKRSALMGEVTNAVDNNTMALPSGESKLTYIDGPRIEDVQDDAFVEHFNEVLNSAINVSESIQAGRLRSKGPLKHMAHRMEDLGVRAASIGLDVNSEKFQALQRWVNDVNTQGMTYLVQRKALR